MDGNYYSAKALRRMLALLALGAGGANVEEIKTPEPIPPQFEDLYNIFQAPASVHFQMPMQTPQLDSRFEALDALRSLIGGQHIIPGIPSTQPIRPPITRYQEQRVAPNPLIQSNQTWRGGGSPGGRPLYSPRQHNSAQTGGQPPIYSSPRIKVPTQEISNRVLLERMRNVVPQEPQPIRLTSKMLDDYLSGVPMKNNVRETIDNLRRRRK